MAARRKIPAPTKFPMPVSTRPEDKNEFIAMKCQYGERKNFDGLSNNRAGIVEPAGEREREREREKGRERAREREHSRRSTDSAVWRLNVS